MSTTLLIVGLGLIGGSIARGLKARGWTGTIIGSGRNAATLDTALSEHVIDVVQRDVARAARQADIVVIATPVGVFGDVLRAIAPELRPGAIVTDVGSVKGSVVSEANRILGLAAPRFVGGHPIAGSEQSGYPVSRPDLFQGRRVVLCPTAETDADALAEVQSLWEGLGAIVEHMDADAHDRLLAWSSHLPHAIAFALMEAVGRHGQAEDVLRLSAGGFRDTTRIAASDTVMWRDILLANREAALEAMAAYQLAFTELEDALRHERSEALMRLLERSRAARLSLNPIAENGDER